MTRPYKLALARTRLAAGHPLHWSRFWPNLQRIHHSQSEARQDLVLWLANLYHGAVRSGRPLGFCSIQVRLMDLRDVVRDYRPALDYFFKIKQLGFFLDSDTTEISTLVPRVLPDHALGEVNQIVPELMYMPPPRPLNASISKVYLRPNNPEDLKRRVLAHGRPELIPQLTWLLEQGTELNFHFVPSGRLLLRDTSVFPIPAIETWPGWLREELFGPGIDLDSAYVQFLVQHLNRAFVSQSKLKMALFPDLFRLLDDKEAFREELCTQVLQRPYTEKNRSLIKRVIMSLANGSKISPALLTNGSGYSQTAGLIIEAAPEATTAEFMIIGARLKKIADQFQKAKRYVSFELGRAPSRQNLKKVFSGYFAWEREARYALWEEIDRHGIMVHDGIDGVPEEYLSRLPEIMRRLDLRLTT